MWLGCLFCVASPIGGAFAKTVSAGQWPERRTADANNILAISTGDMPRSSIWIRCRYAIRTYDEFHYRMVRQEEKPCLRVHVNNPFLH